MQHREWTVAQGYRLLERGFGVVEEPSGAHGVLARSVIEVRGQDRLEWLQGQATQDLSGLAAGAGMEFCFALPTGQVLSDCCVYELGDRALLLAPSERIPRILERFEKMVVMEDVAATKLTGFGVALQGRSADSALEGLGVTRLGPQIAALTETPGSWALRWDRCGWGGFYLWISEGPRSPIWQAIQAWPRIPYDALDVARIEGGIPVFGVDMNERTLAPELGPDFVARVVSYSKGCYVGQEVIHRIHARGHTNRTWMGLLGDGPMGPSSDVRFANASVGVVTSAGVSPNLGQIAAAMLKNEAAIPGTVVEVTGESGSVRARVASLPLRPRLG